MSLSKSLVFLGRYYMHLLKYSPIPTKAFTSASISFAGNVITQKIFEKQPNMNYRRALKFVIVSLLLTPISHFWYKFLDNLFAKQEKEKGKSDSLVDSVALKKLALDELLYDPFCIVFFFGIIGLLEGQSIGQIKQKLVSEYWVTQKASWSVWPIAQLINFSVIPGQFRILFINLIGFFWNIFMQLRQGKK